MLYAVIITKNLVGALSTRCGSDSYLVLDGRKAIHNALTDAVSHFENKGNRFDHIAVVRANTIGSRGSVIACYPETDLNLITGVVNQGAYK